MSRAINLTVGKDELIEHCRRNSIGVSTIETLVSGGVRIVTNSADDADRVRRKFKSKLIDGEVRRTPVMPAIRPW